MPSVGKTPPLPHLRLAIAWMVTFAVVLYAWARTLILTMLAGGPESLFLGLLVGGLFTVIALTYGLDGAFPRPGFTRWVLLSVAIPWILVNGLLVGLYAGSGLSPLLIVALFVPATLWVAWLGWMFYAPLQWSLRLGVLLLLLFATFGFVRLVRIAGMSGDNHLSFAWQWTKPVEDFPEATSSGTQVADLTHTTDHDFPQFLGPERLAVIHNVRLARDWKRTPPREVWRKTVGAGWSGFAVVGDYAITQEQRGPQECVVCYRVSDGEQIWLHADSVRFDSSMGGPGPRATPTIDRGRVYTVGGAGLLNCLDGATGRPIWSVYILKDNAAENIAHGVCGSPLIVDNSVVLSPTGSNGISLAAYDCDTGRRLWQAGKDQAGYSSPLLTTLAGVRQVLLFTAEGITGHDPATGTILWSYPWNNSEHVNCSEPLPHVGGDDQVFISTGYNKGCMLLRVEPASTPPWHVQPLWDRPSRFMKTKFTTPVFHDGYIYGLDDGILECLNPQTGEKLWKSGRYKHGQILLAGDLLLVQTEDGPVVLVEPSPEGLRELGRLPALSGKTWNNPALAGRFLLVRHDHEARCYELPME
jgi:outer membrane protein assembly factor BamB